MAAGQIGQQDGDGVIFTLPQAAGLIVNFVAELFGGLPDQTHFFHADIAAPVDHIGHGAVRDAGFPGDILDGCHTGVLLLRMVCGLTAFRLTEQDVFVWSNPTTAGGAYIATACQIFRLGKADAWTYLKQLDQNVHHYYKGAGDVISPVATGEFIASIAWGHDSFKTQQEGYPLKLIIPKQTAYEIGGSAIVKGGPNTENAKTFMDWLLTREAQELSVAISYRYPVRSDVEAPKGLPALDAVDLVDYDRTRAAEMKESVLEQFDRDILSSRH